MFQDKKCKEKKSKKGFATISLKYSLKKWSFTLEQIFPFLGFLTRLKKKSIIKEIFKGILNI